MINPKDIETLHYLLEHSTFKGARKAQLAERINRLTSEDEVVKAKMVLLQNSAGFESLQPTKLTL